MGPSARADPKNDGKWPEWDQINYTADAYVTVIPGDVAVQRVQCVVAMQGCCDLMTVSFTIKVSQCAKSTVKEKGSINVPLSWRRSKLLP